jgi:hypothetical protein
MFANLGCASLYVYKHEGLAFSCKGLGETALKLATGALNA